MTTDTSTTNIVAASDRNYLGYLDIVLKSLLAHHQSFNVFILNAGDISPEWVMERQQFFAQRQSSLRLVYINQDELQRYHQSGYITQATYLRYYIAKLFEYNQSNRWLYLDCDIVINGDIFQPFSDSRFSQFPLGAVQDPFVSNLAQHRFRQGDYFNAGVLYINADQWVGVTEQLIQLTEKLQETLVYGDQDVLNVYFHKHWFAIDWRYNCQLEHFLLDCVNAENASPDLIHFTGPVKPLANAQFAPKAQRAVDLFRFYAKTSYQTVLENPIGFFKFVLTSK